MNILITGATGLLGRELLREFSAVYTVTGLHRKSSILPDVANATWFEGDLEQMEPILDVIPQFDCVIHAAAKVSFGSLHPQAIIDFNVESTKQIVNACLEHGVKLIHVSSVAALGSFENRPVTEQDDFDINAIQTDYAISKHLSEMEVWRGIAEGLDAIIINPSIILGVPATWSESSGAFWAKIKNGFRYYPPGKTGFVDARDVAKAAKLLLEGKYFGQRFIINGCNASYERFFKLIHQSLNCTHRLRSISKTSGGIAWRLANLLKYIGKPPGYTKAMHNTVCKQINYSNEKILSTIDISFRSLEESVNHVSEQFLRSRT